MSEEYTVCTADIRNRIHEAGIFRPDERIILTTKSSVLLEHFTGKTYSYRRVDLHTLKAKRLFSRPTPLDEAGYRRAIEKMAELPDGASTFTQDGSSRAGELLAHVFHDILPEYGLALRESQLSLSLAMLEAMEKGKVALCEAEVGTGKTHAYLIAAAIYRLFHREGQPVVISTSAIALQKALTEEYIPQISRILLEHRIIGEPLTFTVRKGKSHYACDSRVKTCLSSIKHNNRPEDGKLIEALTALFVGAASLDLDGQPLTDYVKERICVEDCRGTCGLSSVCRYRAFLRKSNQGRVDFQIANHNLVLADVLSRKGGRNRLLPEHGILILDEAHKLLESARQMYGASLEDVELERVAASIARAASCRLCALPKRLDCLLHEDLWSSGRPYLLTSATLSVGGDFSHHMRQTGADLLDRRRILAVSKASPFDYRNHALLYLPEDMPFPDVRIAAYRNAVTDRLEELIRLSHGHTLVLFTSYRTMETVHQELAGRIEDVGIFIRDNKPVAYFMDGE